MSRTTLETLQVFTPEVDVQNFLDGAAVLRTLVEAADLTDILLPLRGAMPLAWALEGDMVHEPLPHQARRHEVPLGMFVELDAQTGRRCSSPNKPEKYLIIEQALEGILHEEVHLGVIDEVQGGGTIIPLVSGILQSTRRRGIRSAVKLFPAEDSRSASYNRKKTGGYRRMLRQEIAGLSTTVVRMPLVFCDRDKLLDEVVRANAPDGTMTYEVRRNVAAEKLFRFLGSASRNPDLAYDVQTVDSVLAALSDADCKAIEEAPSWIKRVVHRQTQGTVFQAR